jgi:hypothetical protein
MDDEACKYVKLEPIIIEEMMQKNEQDQRERK